MRICPVVELFLFTCLKGQQCRAAVIRTPGVCMALSHSPFPLQLVPCRSRGRGQDKGKKPILTLLSPGAYLWKPRVLLRTSQFKF